MNDEISIVLKAKDEASKVIEDMGKKTQASFADIAKQVSGAMAIVGGAITGIGIKALKDFAESQAEMTVATQAISNALEIMSVDKMNKLQKEVGAGVNVFDALTKTMEQAGASAIRLGFDDEEASKAYAKLFQITEDTTQSQKDLQLAMDLARFSGRDLTSAVDAVVKVHAGGTKVLKEFGIEVAEGTTALQALDIVNKRVSGTAEEASKTLKVQMDVLKISMANVSETIGQALAPMVGELVNKVKPLIDNLMAWIEANPKLFEQIVKFAGVAGIALTVLGAIGLALPVIITGFTLLFSPVGLVIGAIGLLIGVLFKLYSDGKLTVDFLNNVIKTIDEQTGLITVLREAWDGIVSAFNEKFRPAIDKLWKALEPFVPYLQLFAKVIGAVLLGALIILIEFISKTVIVILNVFSALLSTIAGVVNVVKAGFDAFVGTLANIFDWVSKVVDKLEAMISALRRAKDATFGAVGNAVGSVKSAIGLASGGIVSQPTYAMIGEGNEPEAVMPLSRLREFAGMGGGGITVNINGGYYLSEDVARDLGGKIIDMLKLNRKL